MGAQVRKEIADKPLRIVQRPILVSMLRGCELMFLCSDGKWYRNREMAKKLNMRPSALRDRFVRMHWSHPDLLTPSRYGSNKAKEKKAKSSPELVDLARMGKNARRQNLAKLAGPGSFERSARY
ncbi:MAG: hypothetical protein VR65_06090 [Desulfobulbaceae bacterium BRH_c16a]|nr:MAG: hypothetical protein VR65_06090 [Desulfobulbaceae bacterium BRH_c16a]